MSFCRYALATVLLALGLVTGAAHAQTSVFLNEIHYDNAGTDVGEAIEVAGPAGTDLTGWSLVLYNGNGGASYNTVGLSGTLPDQCTGYGVSVVTFPTNGLQNGPPDGIALVNGGGSLVQFLSYEGTFSGVGGPANGVLSTDIGVSESSATPVGSSLQLGGSGTVAEDFVWEAEAPESFGACNTNQVFGQPSPPAIVINEIDYDQSGTDTDEFVELYNAGSGTVNLDLYELKLVNGASGGATVYKTIDLPNTSLLPGAFFVVCANAATVPNCDLDVSPNTNLIQNGGPDAVGLFNDGVLVDAVSYEGSTAAPYTEGSGAGLEDNSSIDFASISRLPDGADTDQNNVDLSQRCVSPGTENKTESASCGDPNPPPPTLVINEIDYDQDGTDAAEFVELYNTGSEPIDLDPFEIELVNGSGGGAVIYNSIDLPSAVLAPGEFYVVCGDAAIVPNCDLDTSPNTNLVQNGAPDAVGLRVNGVLADAVSYEGSAGAPYTEGSGSGLVDNPNVDFGGISRFPDGTDTDVNNVDLSARCISPGEVNKFETTDCPNPQLPVTAEIYEIQGSGLDSPFDGAVVTTEDNVVTAVAPYGFFMQTPASRADGDVNTSDGILVFTGGAPGVAVGDLVDVTGDVIEFFGMTEFTNGPTVVVDGSESVPAPVVLDGTTPSPDPTMESCSANNFECFEGMLVEMAEGRVTGPNQRFNPDPIAEVFIVAGPDRAFREPGIEVPGLPGLPEWDGNPEVFELDPDKLGLTNQIIPAGSSFSATGVIGFEFGGYELWPTDLDVAPAPLPVSVRGREDGEATIATLNFFRLFDDVDDPPDTDALGQTRNDFVASSAEYQRRKAKLAAYIVEVLDAPDILAVQEAEKLGVLQDLAVEIGGLAPGVTYTAYLEEGNDIGTIDVGFLVRNTVQVDAVTQLGKAETFINPITGEADILHDRPPLLLEGYFVDGASLLSPIAAMVLHNRSLSGIDGSQGARVRKKRLEQAQSIAQKVQDLQTADPDVRVAVLGDFNAYEFTDGYVDVVGQVIGDFAPGDNLLSGPDLVDPNLTNELLQLPETERYSFIFRGSAQALDHVLTSTGLNGAVTDVAFGRGNADAAIDLINDDSTPLRSTDHDGLVVYLDVTPPEIIVSADPAVLWSPNHKYHSVSTADFVLEINEGLTLADVYVVSVSSDEPEDGKGDGATLDDIVIADCSTVDLRAERDGTSNGRVYTITVAAEDGAGNVGTAEFEVWVPIKVKGDAVDDGPAYSVVGTCTAPAEALAKAAGETVEALAKQALDIPDRFSLSGNYPNPFNPTTTIEFGVPEAGPVSLRVYDMMGREVSTLVDRGVAAGVHRVQFDASNLPSGAYLYRIEAVGFSATKRMILLK